MDRRRIRLRTIWSPPLRCDPRQPAAGGRSLRVPARRFHLACPGAGRSSNRGRLDHGDRDVHAGHFRTLRAADIDGPVAGDEHVSLIYSMLGEVRSFSATPAVADRREGASVNRWSAYFLTHKHWNLKEVRTINEKANLRNQHHHRWLLRPHQTICR